MTRKIMELGEIEQYFKKVMTGVFKRKGIGAMYLSHDIGASEEFLQAETVLKALREIRATGGSINIARKRGASLQEFTNGVAEKIRAFGALAPEGTSVRKLASFVP
ncbi:MAG: hypothetical protein WC464_01265 [Bdellovibrionales bacterium]